MANQLFTTYAFNATRGGSAVTGTVPRSEPDRALDVFNVREFGALGNNISGAGGTDDWAAIQATLDAAGNAGGGNVYVPPGNYYVSKKLIPSYGVGLHLVGAGGNSQLDGAAGSSIWTDQRDYVLYCPHGSDAAHLKANTIKSIRYINFYNTYNGATPTSTEPKSTTNYTDATPGPAGTEGHGGIYLGGITEGLFDHVNVTIQSGIAIAQVSGWGTEFRTCQLHGNFNPDSTNIGDFVPYNSVGMWLRSGSFGNVRTTNFGTCFTVTEGPVEIYMIDIENSYNGIVLGSKPFAFWDPESNTIQAAETNPKCYLGQIRSTSMEKIVNYGVWYKAGIGNVDMINCFIAGGGLGAQQCKVGLKIDTAGGCMFRGVAVSGYCTDSGIDARGASGCTFIQTGPNLSGGGGVPWRLPVGPSWDFGQIGSPSFTPYPSGSASGNTYQFCGIDGAMGLANFPTYAGAGAQIWATDCLYPAAGNVGKPIMGFAVLNAATAVNGTTLSFAPGANNPPFSFLGTIDASHQWYVASVSNNLEIQLAWGVKITAANSGTGAVTVNTPLPSGVTNGIAVVFIAAGGTNKVLARWIKGSGTTPTTLGYWAIAG